MSLTPEQLEPHCPHTGLPIAPSGAGLTEDQLAVRRFRLTGSKIAWALGYNDYDSPSRLWRIDMGLERQEVNEDMWFGNVIEDAIAQLTQRRLVDMFPDRGFGTMFRPGSIFHSYHRRWWVAHPDRIFPLAQTGLQIKNHDPSLARVLYEAQPQDHGQDNNVVPVAEQMQCLWEWEAVASWMADAPAWREWWLGVYLGGTRLRLYRMVRNPKLLDGMVKAGFQWWRSHLNPSGPQSEPSDEIWLRRMERREAKPQSRAPQFGAGERETARRGVQSLDGLLPGV